MSRVVTNPRPKARFQESGDNVSKHRDLIQQREFERAIDWALLEYQHRICQESGDLNQSAAKFLRLQGAHEFINTLRNLAESPVATMVGEITNLDHKA